LNFHNFTVSQGQVERMFDNENYVQIYEKEDGVAGTWRVSRFAHHICEC
jgi:hypothetical protein